MSPILALSRREQAQGGTAADSRCKGLKSVMKAQKTSENTNLIGETQNVKNYRSDPLIQQKNEKVMGRLLGSRCL